MSHRHTQMIDKANFSVAEVVARSVTDRQSPEMLTREVQLHRPRPRHAPHCQ